MLTGETSGVFFAARLFEQFAFVFSRLGILAHCMMHGALAEIDVDVSRMHVRVCKVCHVSEWTGDEM